MRALELTAFGLFGIVLSLAATGLSAKTPYVTVAGGAGVPLEDVLLSEPEQKPRYEPVRHASMSFADPLRFAHGN